MTNLTVYSVSAINTLSARYYDPFYEYKQYRTAYEQGFALNRVLALSGTVDTTINNYTSQYLTSKKRLDDIFTINEKPITPATITTPLIFNSFFTTDEPRYLYIYKNTLSGVDLPETACRASLSSEITFDNNKYFELEILNSDFLRVKHNNGRKDYFLNFISEGPFRGQVAFYSYSSDTVSLTSERNDMFRYLLDSDGYLQLYKIVTIGNGPQNRVLSLSSNGRITFVPILSGSMYRSNSNVIKINYSFNKISPKAASSWISYDSNRQNDLIIDDKKSIFNRKDQYLLHANYNTGGDDLLLNYITLNNARSEKNYIKRGASLIDSGSNFYPDVEFRDYMSLQTGLDQEKGNDNIALTYVWYDKDIKVINGTDTIFKAPSSIYPYDRLNINDTKFVSNGALGGKSPLLSDNVYCLRTDTSGFNNGRYLCTWLSSGSNRQGLWVDRYYYPDLITKEEAMSKYPVFSPSLLDPIDNLDMADKAKFAVNAFFDKKSDLCIEPNSTYKYSRVGTDDIDAYVTSSSPLVSTFTNFYNFLNKPQEYFSNSIIYDGTKYNKFILSDKINESNAFTISFDIYVDPEINYGYQLLGNLTNRGFGVINDEQITPFLFVFDVNKIKSYNSTFGVLYTTTFDQDVLDIVKGKGLNDFHVICNSGYVYKVNALGAKVKLEIVPEIVGYKNYCQDEKYIYFLMNVSGQSVKIDKNTLEATAITAQKFVSYSTYSTSGIKGLLVYNDTLYGVPGENIKYATPSLVYYTLQDKKLLRHNLSNDTVIEFIDTNSEIIDFIIDINDNIVILHNKSVVSVYDKTRSLLFTQNYGAITPQLQLVGVDLVRQYNNTAGGSSIDVVLAFLSVSQELYLYSITNNTAVFTGLYGKYTNYTSTSPRRYKITNYNYYKQLPIENKLNFNLTLTNYLSTEDIVNKSILFDYTKIDRGYHTFTYRFDPLQGNVTLFVDGDIYENVNLPPGKYAIQDIFSDDLYVGSTGFYNGIDLATYLNQPGYYFINNLRLKNLFIYDRAIRDSEVTALNIFGESINDIILSIPAGQRNNMEEIERYFRFSPSASSSKKINIYLKNLGINNLDIKNNIKNLVLQEASTLLPAGVSINDIQFIDFK